MTAVNISGTFKKDERPYNGLERIAKELLDRDRGHLRYVVVAIVRPHTWKGSHEDGVEVPTVRFDQIEVLDGTAADTAKELMTEAYRARTGRDEDPQDTLPFEDGVSSDRTQDEWLDEGDTPPKTSRRKRS